MSESQVVHRDAASALCRKAAGARSQASHTHMRSWREASGLVLWMRESQPVQRYAESALQYTVQTADWQVSQIRAQWLLVLPPCTPLLFSFNISFWLLCFPIEAHYNILRPVTGLEGSYCRLNTWDDTWQYISEHEK